MSLVAEQAAGVEASEWSPPRERTWTLEDARRMEQAWKCSGEKLGTFARRHGVGAERLRWWVRRLKEQEPASAKVTPVPFAPVRLVDRSAAQAPGQAEGPAAGAGGLEVVVGGKRVIRVVRHFDPGLLRQVVAALEEAPC